MEANSHTDKRLEALLSRKRELEAQIQRLESRKRADAHKLDTRRKILAGACVLSAAAQDERVATWLRELLDRSLQKPRDRTLFDLSVQTVEHGGGATKGQSEPNDESGGAGSGHAGR